MCMSYLVEKGVYLLNFNGIGHRLLFHFGKSYIEWACVHIT